LLKLGIVFTGEIDGLVDRQRGRGRRITLNILSGCLTDCCNQTQKEHGSHHYRKSGFLMCTRNYTTEFQGQQSFQGGKREFPEDRVKEPLTDLTRSPDLLGGCRGEKDPVAHLREDALVQSLALLSARE
jgi:hypothetical protein